MRHCLLLRSLKFNEGITLTYVFIKHLRDKNGPKCFLYINSYNSMATPGGSHSSPSRFSEGGTELGVVM